jgi:hypothetical protein
MKKIFMLTTCCTLLFACNNEKMMREQWMTALQLMYHEGIEPDKVEQNLFSYYLSQATINPTT